ncbi:4Fe-4S binding protein [Adlercreutzia caecimuris]|uniref:4Fe-4S binding protein n=1 Tax=Adlercreutzia caecimuris TaxID=671266 RepID=UPI002495A263|nr:4Fe-4S binding protein [Adlercreutzia caecimuris]
MVEKIDAAAHRHVGAAFEAVDGEAIRVHRERCAKVRNRNVECLKCAAACTSGCIALVDGELVLDAAQCVGCGTCATVCPTCALEALNPSDAELKTACLSAVRDGEAVIACSQMEAALGDRLAAGACASVVCAGRVDESLLAALAAEGVSRATVLCGRCDRCAQRHGLEVAELVAETARVLLGAWGSSMDIVVTDEVPEGVLAGGVSAEVARAACDDFFAEERACEPVRAEEGSAELADAADSGEPSAVSCDAARAAAPGASAPSASVSLSSPEAEAADVTAGPGMRFYWNSGHSRKVAAHSLHVMRDGTLPHFVPDRRERLLDALAALGEPAASSVECRLAGAVVIDATRCDSCRMCATFCPTGAIRKFDDADGAIGVEHAPSDCVKCRSCQDVCRNDAITVIDTVPTRWLLGGETHRYTMTPRAVALTDNPHQILDTFRQTFNGDIFER